MRDREYETVEAGVWDVLTGVLVDAQGEWVKGAHTLITENATEGVDDEQVKLMAGLLKQRMSTGHYKGSLRKRWVRHALDECYSTLLERITQEGAA